MSTSFESIKDRIRERGYIKLPYSKVFKTEEILESLGSVIFKTEIRENVSSNRLLATNKEMGLHTDHYKARYIAWFCNSQAVSGGESLLLDTFQLFKDWSEENKYHLSEVRVKSHMVFYGDKLSYPLIGKHESEPFQSVYYAPWLINEPACIKQLKTLKKFENAISSIKPLELLLSEGEILIIDNHRMLHGRNGFPTHSNRWLTRYWISDNKQ